MPLLSVLKAAFRFNRTHGDRRNWRPPTDLPLEQKGGLMFCNRCGTTYLIQYVNQFAYCESCGGPLTIDKKVDQKRSAKIGREKRS